MCACHCICLCVSVESHLLPSGSGATIVHGSGAARRLRAITLGFQDDNTPNAPSKVGTDGFYKETSPAQRTEQRWDRWALRQEKPNALSSNNQLSIICTDGRWAFPPNARPSLAGAPLTLAICIQKGRTRDNTTTIVCTTDNA